MSSNPEQFMNDIKKLTRASEKELALEVLAARYPQQQVASVLPALTKEPDPEYMKGKDWEMPVFLEGKAPRLLILAGLGSINFLRKLVTDKELSKRILQFIFIENDPEVIRHILNDSFGVSLLANNRVRFIFNADENTFKPLLFNILKHPEYSRLMECGQFFVNEEEKDEGRLKFYNTLSKQINETLFHIYHNYGRIDDSLEGVRATLQNQEYIENSAGVKDLKGTIEGKTALVVGAGPSLDAALPAIKENQSKFVIFAADAAVKPLLKHGITPHFTTSIERGNIYQKPFWEGLPKDLTTQLVFYPVVHNEVLALYPGPKRVVYRNYAYYAYWEAAYPKGILSSGGSTSHLAFNLALYMGAKDVVMAGIDHAYEPDPEKEDHYRSHCHGLGHEYWASYKHINDFSDSSKGGTHQPPYRVKAMDGSEVVTNVTYHQWAKEFGEIILNKGLEGHVYITAPKAVVIPGATYTPIETICQSLEPIPSGELEFTSEVSQPSRQFDHKHLQASVNGWKTLLDGVQEMLDDLAAIENDDERDFMIHYINETLTYKLEQDTLFTSMICQNCGYELYKCKNIWYSADDGPDGHETKIRYFKSITQAYLTTINKLKEIIENEQVKRDAQGNT